MREPFATLLAGYQDHAILGPHLQGPEPDWQGLDADEKVGWISSGEKIILGVAAAFAGRDRTILIADLGGLDAGHRIRVAQAIIWSAREGA